MGFASSSTRPYLDMPGPPTPAASPAQSPYPALTIAFPFRNTVGRCFMHLTRLNHFTCVRACRSLCLRFVAVVTSRDGRRRDTPYGAPPPQIPAYGATIPGSCLGSGRQAAAASSTARGDGFGLVGANA